MSKQATERVMLSMTAHPQGWQLTLDGRRLWVATTMREADTLARIIRTAVGHVLTRIKAERVPASALALADKFRGTRTRDEWLTEAAVAQATYDAGFSTLTEKGRQDAAALVGDLLTDGQAVH